jgi:hypothetical protein
VVYERHYDHQQTGGPLTGDDLRLSPSPREFPVGMREVR